MFLCENTTSINQKLLQCNCSDRVMCKQPVFVQLSEGSCLQCKSLRKCWDGFVCCHFLQLRCKYSLAGAAQWWPDGLKDAAAKIRTHRDVEESSPQATVVYLTLSPCEISWPARRILVYLENKGWFPYRMSQFLNSILFMFRDECLDDQQDTVSMFKMCVGSSLLTSHSEKRLVTLEHNGNTGKHQQPCRSPYDVSLFS